MSRTRNVSSEDLDNKYLSDLAGGEGSNNEDAGTGDEGSSLQDQGDTGQDAGGTGSQRQDDGSGEPVAGRQPKTEQTATPGKKGPADQQQPRGNQQQQAKPKINLTDEAQKQVYMAIKDRLQPVFNAQNRQMNDLRRENDNFKAQLKVYTDRDAAATHYKLTPVQQTQSFQMMAAFLKDPPATIKYLIDKATSSGHNIAHILGAAQGGPTPQAIKDMIAEAVQPLTREATARQQQEQLRNQAQEQLDAFYGEFPDAKVHEQVLNMAMQRDPSLTLHRALFELKDYYLKNGFDWSVPLHVISQQRQSQQQNGGRQSQPLNMRGGNGASFDQQDRNSGQEERAAPPSASFKDIVREQMRRAGYNVQNL